MRTLEGLHAVRFSTLRFPHLLGFHAGVATAQPVDHRCLRPNEQAVARRLKDRSRPSGQSTATHDDPGVTPRGWQLLASPKAKPLKTGIPVSQAQEQQRRSERSVSTGSLHLAGRNDYAQHLVLFFAHSTEYALTLLGNQRHALNLDNGVS
jgi:hypothetical protein